MKLEEMKGKYKFKVVIPLVGACRYVRTGKKETRLMYVLDKGYVESNSLAYCMCLSNLFTKVGVVEKVNLKTGRKVYRQRVYIQDYSVLLSVLKEYKGRLHIEKEVKIKVDTLYEVHSEMPRLQLYANKKKVTLDKWLTDSLLMTIKSSCTEEGVECNLTDNVYKMLETKKDYLENSPVLKKSYNKKTKRGVYYKCKKGEYNRSQMESYIVDPPRKKKEGGL